MSQTRALLGLTVHFLNANSLHIIHEDDEEVQQHAPTPTETTKLIQLRDEDYQFAHSTAKFLAKTIREIIEPVANQFDLPELPAQVRLDLRDDKHCMAFEYWCNKVSNFIPNLGLSRTQALDLCYTLRFLIFINNMLDLVHEAGNSLEVQTFRFSL